MSKKTKVVIDDFDGTYTLSDESGHTVESDFESYEQAEQYAKDNGMEVANSFFLN